MKISAKGPAEPLSQAIRRTGEFTIEVWLRPADTAQKGPARIVSLSLDPGLRNLTLGQDGSKFDLRLRTSTTSTNGMPSTATPDQTVTTDLTHLIVTRQQNGQVRFFMNGVRVAEGRVDGTLENWDVSYPLQLANEASGDRPWRGDLHLVALYSTALSAAEVEQNFAAGTPQMNRVLAQLPPAANQKVDFVRDVQPILRTHCFECHASGNEEGRLNLGLRARVLEGGAHGPILSVGHSDLSPMIHRVAAIDSVMADGTVMPPDSEGLSDTEVGVLRAWIDQGADWPTGADVVDPRLERAREHWAFQRLRSVEVPAAAATNEGTSDNPIDRFLHRDQVAAGITPNGMADRRPLIRRLYFDLLGLPPTPEDLAKWEPAVPDELIDFLLASPHYGERWGRHWL
ncbi:MAG: DUF1549 domain-containing protein, partial [Planctomycetaceae bacterium]|nr:DUF1549 domain-containing protein [Planctomycetaceae bacterium]